MHAMPAVISDSFRLVCLRLSALLVVSAWAFASTGCATADAGAATAPAHGELRMKSATGRVLTREEVRQRTATLFFGDETYAEVNSEWLPRFYADFRAELFRLGIVRWDERFDCNRFAELYIGLAQARYYREAFHADSGARALAIAPYWYVRSNGRGTHAVVQALTDRGRIFIDPQTGSEVYLTPQEHATAYFLFF